jgi:prophage regulatory protein
MAATRLISYESLKAKGIFLSKVQLWRLEKNQKFPKRVSTSPGRHAWIESEIDQYIAQKIAERDAIEVAQTGKTRL